MREMLFRGKCIHENKFVYGDFLHEPSGRTFIIEDRVNQFEVDPCTIGQYTGLKSKKGERIFEGDIVSAPMTIFPGGKKEFMIGLIEYLEGAFSVAWGDVDYGRKFAGYLEDIIVISNIHDNPELLNIFHHAPTREMAREKQEKCGCTGLSCIRCNPGPCDHGEIIRLYSGVECKQIGVGSVNRMTEMDAYGWKTTHAREVDGVVRGPAIDLLAEYEDSDAGGKRWGPAIIRHQPDYCCPYCGSAAGTICPNKFCGSCGRHVEKPRSFYDDFERDDINGWTLKGGG